MTGELTAGHRCSRGINIVKDNLTTLFSNCNHKGISTCLAQYFVCVRKGRLLMSALEGCEQRLGLLWRRAASPKRLGLEKHFVWLVQHSLIYGPLNYHSFRSGLFRQEESLAEVSN